MKISILEKVNIVYLSRLRSEIIEGSPEGKWRTDVACQLTFTFADSLRECLNTNVFLSREHAKISFVNFFNCNVLLLYRVLCCVGVPNWLNIK